MRFEAFPHPHGCEFAAVRMYRLVLTGKTYGEMLG